MCRAAGAEISKFILKVYSSTIRHHNPLLAIRAGDPFASIFGEQDKQS